MLFKNCTYFGWYVQGTTVYINNCHKEGVTLNITVNDFERYYHDSNDPDKTHMTFNITHQNINTVKILIPNVMTEDYSPNYNMTVKLKYIDQ